MSSIPAAKEQTQQFGAEVEAILKAWFPGQDRKTAVVCTMNLFDSELSRLEEENTTLTRERDEARRLAQGLCQSLPPWDQRNLPDYPWLTAATLSRQSKEGGE